MPTTATLLAFAAVATGLVLTPGPNTLYMLSRAITQGPVAGLISLAGVVTGFFFYMFAAAFGLTAIVFAVPYAYDALRFAGVVYLIWLAIDAIRPGGKSPFQIKNLPVASPRRLYAMGLLTNLLNPKIAIFYLALLPSFVDPERSVLTQSLTLGLLHIMISIAINTVLACAAGSVAGFLATRPRWLLAQRWIMASMIGTLAVRMAMESRR
ncbi:MAG: LysE family translocator [Pseudolabrys sp.]|nr:LysE family translocator [Pseudolabrys sp.]MDP2297656.1 LysE family translocator [Pseudolabrys sp.]